MNVNKKLDRFKQWAGERMGGEVKTNVSDNFKALEMEMQLRHEGMQRLQKSMTAYIKSLSTRGESDDGEKALPVSFLGSTMINHGEEFENDSEFGNCLMGMGHANERVARLQESFIQNATSSWLESLERSLAQMKEYQAARKKLEQRRLAYDASLSKMQKAKKEDFRFEEELRSQRAKYEESNDDVLRRMEDIKEAEAESVADLGAFLDSELEYYDRCRDVLLQLKRDWPGSRQASTAADRDTPRRGNRSRSGTARSYTDRYSSHDEQPSAPVQPESRPSIRSARTTGSPRREPRDVEPYSKPNYNRASTFEGPTQIHRELTPPYGTRPQRMPTDLSAGRSGLRPVSSLNTSGHVFGDHSDDSTIHSSSSPDRSYGDRSASPATSTGSIPSRTASSTTLNAGFSSGKKMAPPPPPSRAKKPPPPPPPMKRSAASTSNNIHNT
ncbi:hypothetical protein FGG08_001427 [Glutinoglossum americanum]|uniref:BAR domain-containing protein n=1 Tax=Glutinoglossum americanum TaxID=1670608 RepID=A0A9P8IDH8_9PEZI|nr:hypothetical protein FGG08_001427 [Glutinoglossum americanum]